MSKTAGGRKLQKSIRRGGVPAERRKPLAIEGPGFLPKAATLLLRKSRKLRVKARCSSTLQHFSLPVSIFSIFPLTFAANCHSVLCQ
jgi:hypothetical protein